MSMKKRFAYWSLGISILVALIVVTFQPSAARAGVNDVLLGARSSIDDPANPFDPGSVSAANFTDYFTNNGASPSLTIGASNGGALIGAIWTGGSPGDWREIRIVIDSNGDGSFDPLDWDDPTHPWNMTSGQWSYPIDYPGIQYDNGPEGSPTTNDGVIDFDLGESFPWDNFLWWWYEADYDKTDIWGLERGQLMNTYWEGRDQEWNMLPNGNYSVLVQVDEGDDGTFDDPNALGSATEAYQLMVIAILTANITGTVQDSAETPIAGAEVEAGSYLAWGKARTRTDGSFTVSGLEAGTTYHVSVRAPGKVTAQKDVDLPTGSTTTDAGIMTMDDAISITGVLKLDVNANGLVDEPEDQFTPFENQWGWTQNELPVWLDAWNRQGPGWGNGQAFFLAGDSSQSFTVNIPPPSSPTTYQLNIHVEGYAASPVTVSVDTNGGDAGAIVLTKASVLTGSVSLPAPITEWKNIDIQAINTTDGQDRYWGWGNVDPYQGQPQPTPTDTGTFRIDGVPAGTFDLEIRVWGYKTATVQDVVIVQGEDKTLAQPVAIEEGSKISGTLTIQGDTTNLERWEGDTEDPMYIWIDAWSPSAGWGGTNVQVPRGVNQNVGYTIGGLSDGTFEIHSWLGREYELVDAQDNAPVLVTIDPVTHRAENVDIKLRPYQGTITGTIDGSSVAGFDLTKVVVEAKRPWDWLPPKHAMFGDGIDADGNFSVSGLGTGDYVVKAGMYEGFIDWDGVQQPLAGYDGDGILIPSPEVGVVMQRVFVENDALNPTTANVTFEQGYKISGTISLSNTDPPWHDVNENGVRDLNNIDPAVDPNESEAVDMVADVADQPVMAMPMEMMFMGGEDPRMGAVNPDGTFDIVGLAPGVYFVMPPFYSERISDLEAVLEGPGAPQGDFYEGGQETHHWTVRPQMVVVTESDVVGIDFTLGNGYTLSGHLTLPEAQTVTEPWEEFWWIGHLELETPQSGHLGHWQPVFKGDFNDTNRYDFTFHHVANGDYLVRFWSDRYVPGGAKVTVNNANASVNLTIEEGANLVGKLVDADTGEAITHEDGVTVICEAYPWVEGSWRETRGDGWSQSYIEDGSGLQGKDFGGQGGERENKTPGKFHLTALPTGHKYVIYVETHSSGDKTGGAKNYVGAVIAGIDIPEGATGDIDVGTIKLKEGITIQGRITEADGVTPIPGVEVFAFPSDPHDGDIEGEGISDTNGYYTVYGIDPDIEYWDMIAAERPEMFDDWGKQIEWGEKWKYNVAPGSIDVDFVLGPATASLTGTVTIPAGADFMLPFKGEGEEFPATYIIMQRKGVVYEDVLDGFEGMTAPQPSDATTSTYLIENIEPGVYKIFFMNYGLPTQVFDNVEISDGSNTLDVTWNSIGYTVSGSVVLSTGGYPSSSDISGVVCMNASDQTLIFGQLTEEADGTYSAYEVPGLANGQTYELAFYKDSGLDDMPDIFPVGQVTVNGADITDNTATITRNAEPFLIMQAVQDTTDTDMFHIGIFSTTYLVDESISVVGVLPTTDSTAGEIYIQTGSGSLSGVTLSGDKRNISATYTKDASDTTVELVLAVHYGRGATTKIETLSFNVNSVASNGDVVNTYTAGQVKLGNGDGSQVYVPAGSLDAGGEKVSVNIEKSTVEPVVEGLSLSSSASGLGVFAASTTTPLPSGVTAAGDQYDISVSGVDGGTVTFNGTVTVQIQYDPGRVSDTDLLNVYHYVSGAWRLENTNRTLDTENNTISVEVTNLSPFIAGEGTPPGTPVAGGSSGGGCFITTAVSGSN